MTTDGELLEHLTRMDYGNHVDALEDAVRVQEDLLAALQGQIVVPVESIEFLARRALSLTRGCARDADSIWTVPSPGSEASQ